MSNKLNLFAMPLVLVHSIQQFEKIEVEASKGQMTSTSKVICNLQRTQTEKHNIITPRCGKISNFQQFKVYKPEPKLQISNMGYIRLKIHHNLPSPFSYELTDQDISVLNYLKDKYPFDEETEFMLEQKHMTLIFRWCEEISHSTDSQVLKIFSDEKLISENIANSLDGNFDEKEREKLSSLVCELFQYWKVVKKDRFNQPLIRKFWPKENYKSKYFDNLIPYKSRYPSILDPVIIPYELKVITTKTGAQKLEIPLNVISSLDEWKVLQKTHRKKKKEFQKMVKNFHFLAQSYGFRCQLETKRIWNPRYKLMETEISRSLREFQDSKDFKTSESSYCKLNRTEFQKIRPKIFNFSKSAQFMSIEEWIRHQKRMILKQKIGNDSCQNIYESYESIEMLDGDEEETNDDISVVERTQFYDNAFLEVQKQLHEQEIFRYIINEDEEIDFTDESMLESENFYDNLDLENIPEPEDFFFKKSVYCDQIKSSQQIKSTKLSNDDDLNSSKTTIYQNSQQTIELKKRFCSIKQKTKPSLKKKVKK